MRNVQYQLSENYYRKFHSNGKRSMFTELEADVLHRCGDIVGFWGALFQRTLESSTCHDWTASKFVDHVHKDLKRTRGWPFCSELFVTRSLNESLVLIDRACKTVQGRGGGEGWNFFPSSRNDAKWNARERLFDRVRATPWSPWKALGFNFRFQGRLKSPWKEEFLLKVLENNEKSLNFCSDVK